MAQENAKVRVARLAARAGGRITWAQLAALAIPDSTIARWAREGYLHQRLPGVYAVGHAAPSLEGELAEALLYAGPGAMLSHDTAAWWLGLLGARPALVHVSTPRRCRSTGRVLVHARRALERGWHNRLPVTTIPQTLLDIAVALPFQTVRLAMARADYGRVLELDALEARLGRGRPGSALLRAALAEHQPELAHTRSELERALIAVCERGNLVIPELNVRLGRWTVDAVWWDARLVVEVDGYDNHRSPAQVRRDRQKEMDVRAAGLGIVRYSSQQVFCQPAEVLADLLGAGAPTRGGPATPRRSP